MQSYFLKKGALIPENILNLDLIQDHCGNLSGCQKLSFGSVINSYIKYFFIFNSRLKNLYYKSGQNLNGHIMDRQLTTAGLSTLIQPLGFPGLKPGPGRLCQFSELFPRISDTYD